MNAWTVLRADLVMRLIPFGLQVYAVQSQLILADYAINAAVARSPELLTRV